MAKQLTDIQKLMMKKILGPDPRHVELMFLIWSMPRCDEVLIYLLKNNYIGQNLSQWITRDHEGSLSKVHHFLSQRFSSQ